MNNDYVIIKNIKLFIYSLDSIIVNIPNRDKIIKDRLYNTSYNILYLGITQKVGTSMGVSYSKLFKLLIDKKMKKKDLISAAGISSSTMAKLGKDEYVNVEVLVKICNALDANIGDIMDVIPDQSFLKAFYTFKE